MITFFNIGKSKIGVRTAYAVIITLSSSLFVLHSASAQSLEQMGGVYYAYRVTETKVRQERPQAVGEDLEECERQWWFADASWRQAASSDSPKDVPELPPALHGRGPSDSSFERGESLQE